MDELNNWDEDTINHLIHKLQLDAETARLSKESHYRRELNANPENFGETRTFRDESFTEYGQEKAYRYLVRYLQGMLADNAEAIEQASRTN